MLRVTPRALSVWRSFVSDRKPVARRILRIVLYMGAALLVVAACAYLLRFDLTRIAVGLPPFTHSAGPESFQMLPMRDGTRLATTTYLPSGAGPWPAILMRNPYLHFDVVVRSWCGRFVRYGYACVYQDVRGQGESEAEWEPLVNESRDGQDTLRWLVAQPFQDGNTAMVGPSYLAAVQWAAAAMELPPEVKTFVPSVFTSNPREVLYQNGMFRHEMSTAWVALMPRRGMRGRAGGEGYQRATRHRPHREVDELFFGGRLPWYREWLSSPAPMAPLWQGEENRRLVAAPETLRVPILMIAGWYDIVLGPQLGDWQRLATRSQSRLIVGPWTHLGSSRQAIETPDAGGGLMQWPVLLDWVGHHLKGEPLENRPGVATYVMREGRWVERSAWPPPTEKLRLYLIGTDEARRCEGGRLAETPAGSRQAAHFVYDPENPVPTRGGAGMLAFILPGFGGAPTASVWQEALCEREDVLSFASKPLDAPLHIAGTIEVGITATSDAADTSFTAKLVEVLPDGRAVNIRDSITSLAYRNGAATPRAYTPGEPVDLLIPFWPIEWKVPAGSRLRLDVSSSDFPKFHAHSNRAGLWSEQTDSVKAAQAVLTGPGRGGWLDLPRVDETTAVGGQESAQLSSTGTPTASIFAANSESHSGVTAESSGASGW